MKLFIKLMILIPLLRLLILADEEEGNKATPVPPDYTELDELVKLHARAILHMNKLGWPVGGVHRVLVGYQPAKGNHWWSRMKSVPIYEDMFGASSFAGFYIMRSGAVYGKPPQHDGRPRQGWRQLDLALIDREARRHLIEAFEYILDMTPQPVYLP